MQLKSLAVCSILSLFNLQSFSQGTINFLNSSSELVTILATDSGATLANADSATYGTRVQLFYQPVRGYQPGSISLASSADNFGWMPVIGNVATNVTTSGRFSAGVVSTGLDVPGGGSVWLQAVAWTGANLGSTTVYNTYNAAVTAIDSGTRVIFGESEVWQQVTGNPNASPPTVPVKTSDNGLTGILLWPGPEPSTIALTGLGAAVMLLARRKK